MKIVLTGGTGFIGKNLMSKLYNDGYEIFCLVREKSVISDINSGIQVVRYYAKKDLYRIMEEIKPDVLVHLAGFFLNEHSKDNIEELVDSNITFSTVLFDAANKSGCKKIVNTSSYWKCYQGDEYNPVNLYAATKRATEDILIYYVKAHKWSVLNLIIFDVYGAKDKRSKLINIIHKMQNGESIGLTGGEQLLYFCYIDDVISAYERAITMVQQQGALFKEYAIRSDEVYTLREILETYLHISGKELVLNWGERTYKEREFMNPKNVGTILEGWYPKYDLRQGLTKYCSESDIDG